MNRGLLRVALACFALLAGFALFAAAAAADATWPREIVTDRGTLTIYQPQPEKFDGNTLQGRAAASYKASGGTNPTFGVFWFTGRVDTDRDAGTSMLRDIVVTDARWPDSKEEAQRKASEFVTALMPKTGIPISLERLEASLATAEMEQKGAEGFKNDPPKIVVVEELAELLLYDGAPRSILIPGTELEQVANCAFAVVKDKRTGDCYLSGGKIWYGAKDPMGPWAPIDAPPADIAKMIPPDTSSAPRPAKPPRIVVATEPTELIASDGPPSWQPIGSKAELMYIANAETPVLREVKTGSVYVLISGRWYRAGALDGPWTFVRNDQLPAAFQDIPPGSALGAVRVSVAGTPEAEDAMLDAHVPQTAAIERDKAKLEVTYDGEPKFKAIEGTGIEYAVNTSAQVLKIEGRYYACDEAVWFVAMKPTGPWAVADSVPAQQIKQIPPSEPVYNVTNVTIYESTPQVVYVGYTPGYMWSYPYYGCPIYGTGWYYPPYWGAAYYYPRPVTYGFHVTYNPYMGWGMGFSYGNGFMTVGVHFGGGYGGYYRPGYPPGGYYRPPPYYPPGGYRPPYYPPGHRPGTPRPPYGGGSRPGAGGGGRPSTLPAGGAGRPSAGQLPANNNLYQQSGNRDRVAPSTMQRDAGLQKADRVAKGPNNVYAGTDGQVYRQTQQGWQSRDQGQWKSSAPSTRPAQPPSAANRPSQPQGPSRPSQPPAPANRPSQPGASTRPSYSAPSNLNRDAQARQNGASRSAQPRPSGGAPRRGGGGGRGR